VTVTTKKGRQSTPPGHYDPATGKTVSWMWQRPKSISRQRQRRY
jgi:hypothetical protein